MTGGTEWQTLPYLWGEPGAMVVICGEGGKVRMEMCAAPTLASAVHQAESIAQTAAQDPAAQRVLICNVVSESRRNPQINGIILPFSRE